MAGMDYYNCDSCGAGKIFYDANVDWEGFGERIGQIRATCSECFNNGVRIKITNKVVEDDQNWGVHCHTRENAKQ